MAIDKSIKDQFIKDLEETIYISNFTDTIDEICINNKKFKLIEERLCNSSIKLKFDYEKVDNALTELNYLPTVKYRGGKVLKKTYIDNPGDRVLLHKANGFVDGNRPDGLVVNYTIQCFPRIEYANNYKKFKKIAPITLNAFVVVDELLLVSDYKDDVLADLSNLFDEAIKPIAKNMGKFNVSTNRYIATKIPIMAFYDEFDRYASKHAGASYKDDSLSSVKAKVEETFDLFLDNWSSPDGLGYTDEIESSVRVPLPSHTYNSILGTLRA